MSKTPDDNDRLRERRASGAEKPCPLPWEKVNAALGGGLWPGLHVLVGGTGSGKTQWVLQAALCAAGAGTPVLYLGLELSAEEVAHRLLALADHPDGPCWSDLQQGKAAPNLATEAALAKLPMAVEVVPPMGWNPAALPAAVVDLRQRYNAPDTTSVLVALDYLQVVGANVANQELRERIGAASYMFRAVARDHNAAVLVVSSTSREGYKAVEENPGKGPAGRLVGWGKESGEIEYAADTVLVLTAEPWDGKATAPPDGTHVHLAIAKNRAGRPDWVDLRFDRQAFGEPGGKAATAPVVHDWGSR